MKIDNNIDTVIIRNVEIKRIMSEGGYYGKDLISGKNINYKVITHIIM